MNKKNLVNSLLSVIAFLFLFGCATKEPMKVPSFSPTIFDTKNYDSKVDNFIVVVDASGSMLHKYKGTSKFDIAKIIGNQMNLTIPELGQTAGVRSLGHHPEVSKKSTELIYGMETYSTAKAAASLNTITKPGGGSPLGAALAAVTNDLDGLDGIHNAVIILSDGMDMNHNIPQIQELKDKYGSSICFYPILVGDAPEGKAFLQEIARIGDCGFFSNADEIMTGDGMAAFVEKVFLTKKMMAAAAPMAPKIVKTERKDSDKDGVYDDQDQCPGTPVGAKVNAVGCWTLDSVLFDFDKAEIKPEGFPLLDAIVVILKKNPAMSVELAGHTDNVGTEAYNMDLSMRRSNAVAAYLVDKGILRNRLATTGFGFKNPAALNGTKFGRSLNRRVELNPY